MTREKFIDSYKSRGYLHFDVPFSDSAHAWEYVEKFRKGEDRGFLPFLGFTLTSLRLEREKPEDGIIVPRRLRTLLFKPKHRSIKIASHKDAAIYSYYGLLLSELYEQRLLDRSLSDVPTAFRKVGNGRCNIDHAKEVFDFIQQNRPCVALGFDVRKFFDRLSHVHLRNAWADILGLNRLPEDHYRVYRSLSKFTWVSRKSAYAEFGISEFNPKMSRSMNPRSQICSATEFRSRIRSKGFLQCNPERNKGIPQGAPMSAILSNIYMLSLDEAINNWIKENGGLYRRYCDDMVVVVAPDLVESISSFVEELISGIDLELNHKKTERADFNADIRSVALNGKNLPYLGFLFDGKVVRLRQSSLDRYYGKMRNGVRAAVQCQKKQIRKHKCAVPLRTRKLYLRYSHLAESQRGGVLVRKKCGKSYKTRRMNFITYALRSARVFDSPEIRHQVRGHWKKVRKQINKKNILKKHRSPLFP